MNTNRLPGNKPNPLPRYWELRPIPIIMVIDRLKAIEIKKRSIFDMSLFRGYKTVNNIYPGINNINKKLRTPLTGNKI
jgi:hypothetical protein